MNHPEIRTDFFHVIKNVILEESRYSRWDIRWILNDIKPSIATGRSQHHITTPSPPKSQPENPGKRRNLDSLVHGFVEDLWDPRWKIIENLL
jgi:hypothetical protein